MAYVDRAHSSTRVDSATLLDRGGGGPHAPSTNIKHTYKHGTFCLFFFTTRPPFKNLILYSYPGQVCILSFYPEKALLVNRGSVFSDFNIMYS